MRPRSRALLFPGLMLGLVLGLVPAPRALGETPAVALTEINYLLTFMGASGCEFYRNGSWYDSRTAQAHLRDKYVWLAARDRIKTAEDFIEQAATRSILSGEPYAVRCGPAAPISSNRWLHEQLGRYRAAATLGAPREMRGGQPIEPAN